MGTVAFSTDGNDGRWSTFAFQIGSPPQVVRLLPSITGNSIWTVWSEACIASGAIENCASLRGNVFNISGSSTWETQGNYSLDLRPQTYLPYSGGAVLGYDNVTLDWPEKGNYSLPDQVIDAYVTDDLFLGSFGLRLDTINISDYNNGIPSFLASLREHNLIPSASWSYLAGAYYRSFPEQAYASLTLGGYDLTRLNVSNNLTLAGGTDQFRPYLVGVNSIRSEGVEFLSEPIITALDSLVTHIWLPLSACEAFERAFGLVWNETYSLYLLNTTQHDALVARNASITFELSQGIAESPDRLNITLPYGAFDVQASPPFEYAPDDLESHYYFPLKRAANETQYTLGRVFFQEVYMVHDFDNGLVALYEAVYPDSSVESVIIPFCPPNSTTCVPPSNPAPPSSSKLATGAIAGIAVGAGAVLIAVLAFIWWKCLRKQPPRDKEMSAYDAARQSGVSEKPELPANSVGSPRSELAAHSKHGSALGSPELDSGYASDSRRREGGGGSSSGPSESAGAQIHEALGSSTRHAAELYGSVPARHELSGSDSWGNVGSRSPASPASTGVPEEGSSSGPAISPASRAGSDVPALSRSGGSRGR